MNKTEKLRAFLKQNSKYLKLTSISKEINNGTPQLLSHFTFRTYNGKNAELGEHEQKTLEFFENQLDINLNEQKNVE
jgi:hypothetical protein